MSARYLVIGVLLLAFAAGVGTWQRRASVQSPEVVRLDPGDDCDLRAGPCTLGLGDGGRVTFAVTPRTLPPMEPLALAVTVTGSGATAAWVDFVGVDMDMGFNRIPLRPAGTGRFAGEATIPVCVRDRMWWEAQVLLTEGGRWVSAPFRFEVARGGSRGAEGKEE